MRLTDRRLILLAIPLLTLSACGKNKAANTVDDSTLSTIKGASLVEGTTNDSSALEAAAETGNADTAPAAGNAATAKPK